MADIRIGIIGQGGMGRSHAKYLVEGKVPGGRLTAVCDASPEQLQEAEKITGSEVKQYPTHEALLASGEVDGVLICVPHYFHPSIAIDAFKQGCHVLTEKPAGVYTKQVHEMNEAAEKSGKVFGIMFQARTRPANQKMHELLQAGELGDIIRTQMMATHSFRSQSYFDLAGWRGTWKGEGGGVLINQAPHDLDQWQWICGVPKRVRAFCGFGQHHNIEVEDNVTAFVEYANGATGTFIASTSEVPGESSLVVNGDRGMLKLEKDKLTLWKTEMPLSTFNKEYKKGFGRPKVEEIAIEIEGEASGHAGITSDWVSAIRDGTPLLAPGKEGLNSLEISNAIHLSTWIDGLNCPSTRTSISRS